MAGMKKAIRIPALSEEQRVALAQLYRRTQLSRVRTRAQMILLSVEQRLKAEEIAPIVRESAVTVLTWLKDIWQKALKVCKMHPERVETPGLPKSFGSAFWKVSGEGRGV